MEDFGKMLARHQQEKLELFETQRQSWGALRAEYGDNIPPVVLEEWNARFGNARLHALEAQHDAERRAHPVDPRSYAYLVEDQKPQPTMEEYQQQQKAKQEAAKHAADHANGQQEKSVFDLLQEEEDKKSQQPGIGLEP